MTRDDSRDNVDLLKAWWSGKVGDMPADVVGLWFGLFEETSANATKFRMYVAGTRCFSVDDDGDWATDYVWLPKNRYLPVECDSTDWAVVIEHGVSVVVDAAPWALAPSTLQGVGVGFDDGDVRVVWARNRIV